MLYAGLAILLSKRHWQLLSGSLTWRAATKRVVHDSDKMALPGGAAHSERLNPRKRG